tara:strand:+ start:1045 stop:1998 length:954 start_codon:yes stop_codon:yes gene_type:complete
MINKLLVVLKTIAPLSIGLLCVYFSYKNTSLEDRNYILNSILMADYTYVFFGISLGILSHFSRAQRWGYLLNPIGFKIKFSNSIMAIMVANLGNLAFPRSGELLRASSIYAYEKIPFEKGFGTIISERIIDLIILFFCIILGAYLSPNLWRPETYLNEIPITNYIIPLFLFVILFVLLINKLSFKNKFKKFILGLKEGILAFSLLREKKKFVFHTFFIWLMYFLMMYVIKFSLPETYSLGLEPMFIAFVAGAIAMSTTNGGIGVYPLAIATVLSQYNISYEIALAFGWIIWTSQTLMIIIFGSLSFVFLPILNKNKT